MSRREENVPVDRYDEHPTSSNVVTTTTATSRIRAEIPNDNPPILEREQLSREELRQMIPGVFQASPPTQPILNVNAPRMNGHASAFRPIAVVPPNPQIDANNPATTTTNESAEFDFESLPEEDRASMDEAQLDGTETGRSMATSHTSSLISMPEAEYFGPDDDR